MTSGPSFKEYVGLLYHEARNVRHLIRGGQLSAKGWEVLTSLPTNRDAAWRAIDRFAATVPDGTHAVIRAFEEHFHQSLDQLTELFENPNWMHAKLYGGNAWARIARKVLELGNALIAADEGAALRIERELQVERHNTGTLESKLTALRSATR